MEIIHLKIKKKIDRKTIIDHPKYLNGNQAYLLSKNSTSMKESY